MMRKPVHPLVWICLLGLGLRVWFALTSNHIYYPDEIFQSLEQAHRIVYGYGVIPWDVLYGLRTMAFPLFLSMPLWVMKLISVTDPNWYTLLMRIFIGSISLVLVPAAYTVIGSMIRNRQLALLSAFLMATWYELIYFSPRALTELFSVYCLALAVTLILRKRLLPLAGFIAVSGLLLRIHYAPLFILLVVLAWKMKLSLQKLTIGGLLSLLLFGMIDRYFYGSFLTSIPTNIRLSFLSGVSEFFGTKPWTFYISSLGISSVGVIVFVVHGSWKIILKNPLFIGLWSTVLLHSIFPHKEYRFIFAAIPLWLLSLVWILSTPRYVKFVANKLTAVYALAVIITVLGFFNLLPYQTNLYIQPLLLQDPHLRMYSQASQQKDLCGLLDPNRSWVFTGGYYHLHQQAPVFNQDGPDWLANDISHILTDNSNLVLAGFIKAATSQSYAMFRNGRSLTMPGYTLYQRIDAGCIQKAPDYIKTFPDVNTELEKIDAHPKLRGFI